MASGNGKAPRPFGPHGEGCECDPEDVRSEEEAHPTEAVPHVTLRGDDSHPIEVIMSAIAAAHAATFISAVDTCTMDGAPLTPRQITHLLAGIMRGHAIARETAQAIWANYYRMYQESTGESTAAKEETKQSPATSALQDISELFHRKPDEDADDEA